MAAELGEYVFRVGEGGNRGKPVFLWLELRDQLGISVFANALVTLKLRDSDDIQKASGLAALLNEQVEAVGYPPLP